MFNLKTLILNNFRSYTGEHTFEFPGEFGLYFLTGKNLLEPALGANGAGKSTFLEAIIWCLYGHTTRGLKANEILSWHADTGAQVTLILQVGDSIIKVKRTQKPNGLFIDGKPVDQKELETHIRLNYAAFTHSVLSPQFGKPFFSLSSSEKLTLFSDINELDHWLKKSDEAAKLAKQQEAELTALTASINRAEGKIESITADIAELEVSDANFEAERADKLANLESEADEIDVQLTKLGKELRAARADKAKIAEELPMANDRLLVIEMRQHNLLKDVDNLSQQRRDHNHDLNIYRARRDSFKSLKGYCTACEQSVEKTHAKQVLDFTIRQMISRAEMIEDVDKQLGSVTKKIIGAKLDVTAARREVNDLNAEIADVEAEILKLKNKVSRADESYTRVQRLVDETKVGTNPFRELLVSKRDNLRTLRQQISSECKVRTLLEASHIATTFWVKGFKRIRLFIIERAFETLEVEVNNSLAQLGMLDWQVTFDVERENKSGSITKGFIVLIKSPSNKVPVRWENWSGGETQRLQLAGDLGLANLIMQQAGLQNSIEFYDEPSTHLSSEGMMDLADMLHERAITEGKRVWIADHTAITSFGEFEGIITARKDKNGASSITFE